MGSGHLEFASDWLIDPCALLIIVKLLYIHVAWVSVKWLA